MRDRRDILKCVEHHQEIYGKLPEFLFFDEIQSLDGWSALVYELYEKKRFHIFITGSSSKLLSQEIATQMRGRSVSIPVFPFSFREFLNLNSFEVKGNMSSYDRAKLLNLLRGYIESGGFPPVILDEIKPEVFFRDYVDAVIYRDIVERYGVREPHIIKMLIKFITSSYSSVFSVNKVFNTMKSRGIRVSRKTIYAYFQYILNSFFSFTLKKFAFSEREMELSLPKVYLSDTGLINYLPDTRTAENLGRHMENLVFIELRKREMTGDLRSLFYYRNANGHEVDFVVVDGSRVSQLIQVTYASNYDEIDPREIRGLIHAGEHFKGDHPELLVITWDYEDERDVRWFGKSGRIRFIPLWRWLVEGNSANV